MSYNFKIGQKVYVPFYKKYFYINGIKHECFFMGASSETKLCINENPNVPTNAKGTLKVGISQVEVI